MVPVKQIAARAVVFILLAGSLSGGSDLSTNHPAFDTEAHPAGSLFAQSAAQVFLREFDQPDLSFLLLDAKTGALLASRWNDPARRIPMGSLVKPFTALAYGEQHQFRYPTHLCKGESSGCWRPAGHGVVNIRDAIANSCNSYFRMLTAEMSASDISPTTLRFGLDEPDEDLQGAALAGLGNGWLISPIHMARAYLQLSRWRDQLGVADILLGMAQSARVGTGKEVGRAIAPSSALVKTGTAACTHEERAPGDGFAVVLFPADEPELLLLVRVHGVPGSKAAKIAGQMLSRIEE
jgi:hypothetical protein